MGLWRKWSARMPEEHEDTVRFRGVLPNIEDTVMTFFFRGVVVFEYDPDFKEVEVPNDKYEWGNFNYCKFIPEDYKLIAEFFNKIHQYETGEIGIDQLTDIEVY